MKKKISILFTIWFLLFAGLNISAQTFNIDQNNLDHLINYRSWYEGKLYESDLVQKVNVKSTIKHLESMGRFDDNNGVVHFITIKYSLPYCENFTIKYNYLKRALGSPDWGEEKRLYSLVAYVSSYEINTNISAQIIICERTPDGKNGAEKERIDIPSYEMKSVKEGVEISGIVNFNGRGDSYETDVWRGRPNYTVLGSFGGNKTKENIVSPSFIFERYTMFFSYDPVDEIVKLRNKYAEAYKSKSGGGSQSKSGKSGSQSSSNLNNSNDKETENSTVKGSDDSSASDNESENSQEYSLPEIRENPYLSNTASSKPVYDQNWLNKELQKQKQIEQQSQYVVSTITTQVSNVFAGIYAEQQFNKKVSGLTKLSFDSHNPAQLLGEYKNKSVELERGYQEKTEYVTAQMITYVNQVNSQLSQDGLGNAQAQANNAAASIMIARRVSQLRAEEETKQQELDDDLKEKMTRHKNELLTVFEKNRDNSYRAAINVLDARLEDYYLKNYRYYRCMVNDINRRFDHKSTAWLDPNCNQPSKTSIQKDLPGNSSNCLEAATRKLGIYINSGDKNFLSQSRRLVDASLAYNNKNAKAYYLKSRISESLIDQYTYIKIAKSLDPGSASIDAKLKIVSQEFSDNFFKSIRTNDIENILPAVNKKFHLGLLNSEGMSPIEYSIKMDRGDILEILLNNEINKANTLKLNGYNYLFYCARNDSYKCMKVFVKNGLKVDAIPSKKETDAITIAASSESYSSLKSLLSEGYNFEKYLKTFKDKKMYFELSVLSKSHVEFALDKNKAEVIDVLKEYHPGIFNEKTSEGNLGIIEYTLKNDNEEVLKRFISFGWNPKSDQDIITKCLTNKSTSCLNFLLEYYSEEDFISGSGNLYHKAVDKNASMMISILKSHNYDVNYMNAEGNTPLTHAILEKNSACAKAIIQAKADLDMKNEKGWAPIHLTVISGLSSVCKLLAEQGADVNLLGEKKFSALHYAAIENNKAICDILISAGANKELKDAWGRTPLKIAREKKYNTLYSILK